MKKYFIEAIDIIKPNIALIVILALMPSLMFLSGLALLLSFIMILFLSPTIHGYFTETILGEKHTSFKEIFKRHALNYYAVILTLYIPLFVIHRILNYVVGEVAASAIHTFISVVIMIFSIYIYPLVFLKRMRMLAIIKGVACLAGSFRQSLPLVLLTLLSSAIFTLVTYVFRTFWVKLFPLGLLLSQLPALFLQFMVFITASLILVKAGVAKKQGL